MKILKLLTIIIFCFLVILMTIIPVKVSSINSDFTTGIKIDTSLPINIKNESKTKYNVINTKIAKPLEPIKKVKEEPLEPVKETKEEILKKNSTSDINDCNNNTNIFAEDEEKKSYIKNVTYNNQINISNTPIFSTGNTIGYISCDSANLDCVPITYGFSQDIIDSYQIGYADGFASHPFLDNIVTILCGHNNKALYNLHNVSVGDKIQITTDYNANFLYEVYYSKIVKDVNNSQFIDLNTGENLLGSRVPSSDLQIFTCVDGMSIDYRYFVIAKQIKGTKICY